MALLVTPGQLTSRSELFHQLAQITASGLGLIAALEILHRSPPRLSMREPIQRLLAQLQDGSTFGSSLEHTRGWLSSFDVALLQAGELSGRLPECFRLLAGYYAQRAQLARQVIAYSIYPLIILHVAVLIFPVNKLTALILQGAVIPYVAQKAVILLPIYGLALFLMFALQGTRGGAWRASVERVLNRVPVLGKARRNLALARLSIALEALLNAGVNIIEAWELAARASGSIQLQNVFAQWRQRVLEGAPPSEMVSGSGAFPPAFASLYHTGEVTGSLDDALRRSHAMFDEEGARGMKQFVFGLAGALVVSVLLLAGWQIVSFYAGYFRQIDDAINFNSP